MYEPLIDQFASNSIRITQNHLNIEKVQKAAEALHKKHPHRSLEKVFMDCLIGEVGEVGVATLLALHGHFLVRFSEQDRFDNYKFDLACVDAALYRALKELKIDVKVINGHSLGDYFTFNCYADEESADVKVKGSNMNMFVNYATDTEYLILVVIEGNQDDGWIVTIKYIIHRDAFNTNWGETKYPDSSPAYFLRYHEIIANGHCVKIGE